MGFWKLITFFFIRTVVFDVKISKETECWEYENLIYRYDVNDVHSRLRLCVYMM